MNVVSETLGAIADRVGGTIRTGPFGSQLHQSDYQDMGVPVVMPKNIVGGRVSTEGIARVSDEHVQRLEQHQLSVGDIVYGRRGDIGRCAIITERERGWLCGTGCLRISLGSNNILDPAFLCYYLVQPRVVNWIYNQAVGATMANLNTDILRRVPVRYPPLPTQRKIASILGAYDDLIENNLRRIQILEEMARLLYREWFVHYRFPGHEDMRMVDSPLGKIPEGWEIARVADVAYIQRGRSYRGKDIVEGGLPFYNLKSVDRGGGFRIEGIKRYTGRYKDSQTARPGDILVAVTDMTQERNIVAEAARIPDTGEEFGVFSMDLVKVTPGTGTPPEYLYGMLRFSPFSEEVKQYANGVNVLHLSPDRIAEYEFPIATDALRCRYADAVRPAYREVDILTRKNDTLCVARDLLLPRLISGELDVSELRIDVGEEGT